MYRNTYLQMYKNASANDSTITFMFAHFTQIYNTLGCVLQDLQFQIGKMLAPQPSPVLQKVKQPYQQYTKPKQKAKDKQVIKIQESQSEFTPRRPIKQFSCQMKDKFPQKEKEQANPSLQSSDNWLISRILQGKQPKKKQIFEMKSYEKPQEIARKPIPSYSSGGSFNNLFDNKANQPIDLEQQPPQASRLAVVQSLSEDPQPPAIENTYEDFLDRFFKQDKSKKSK